MATSNPALPMKSITFWGVDGFSYDMQLKKPSTTLFDTVVNNWLKARTPQFQILQWDATSGSSWGVTQHLLTIVILYQEPDSAPNTTVSDGFDDKQFK